MPQPARKISTLIHELTEFLLEETVDEIGLARLKNEAKPLLIKNPAEGHLALGMIACIRGDVEKTIHHHELSIKIGKNKLWLRQNYVLSLYHLGMYSEGLEKGLSCLEEDKQDVDFIHILLTMAIETGDLDCAKKLDHFLSGLEGHSDLTLDRAILCVEETMKNDPNSVVRPDPALLAEVESLIDGVEV